MPTFRNIPNDYVIADTFADLPTSVQIGTLGTTRDTQDVYVFDGSVWQIKAGGGTGLLNLNGETGNTQTFDNGTDGTEPNWDSAANVHTLNIPLAVTSGVTQGLISNTEFETFNDKQDALGYVPLNKAGDSFTGRLTGPNGTTGSPTFGFTGDSDSGIWSTGDGNVSISANSQQRLSVNQNDTTVLGNLNITGNAIITGDISAANYPPTDTANKVAIFDSSGVLDSITTYSINSSLAIDSGFTINPNAGGGNNLKNDSYNFIPLQNSPAETWNIHNMVMSLDPTSTGFNFGTDGQAARFFFMDYSHQGTGDVGELGYFLQSFNLGNGTDPISIKGLTYSYLQGQVNADVTINGNINGMVLQPSFDASTVTTGSFVFLQNGTNFASSIGGWTELNLGPQIADIKNNSNYTGINFNPTITNFTGNAGANVIAVAGNFGTFDTGSFNAININPTVTDVVNATGLYINMNSVTASGNKHAIDVTGDVSINGALTFSGALSIGQLNAFATATIIDGGGNPTSVNGLIASVSAPASSTIANCDTLGLNTAMLINLGANSTLTSGPIGLGLAALALPCVVETHTGSSLDQMSAAAYAISMSGTSTGGTIDEICIGKALVIPNGITTINQVKGWHYSEPFGAPATDRWGIYMEDAPNNFLEHGLKIGGSDTLTNSSIGLEFSVTKAPVLPNVTTAEKTALTAVNGMMVYDTDLGKGQLYEAGAWVNLV